METRKITVEEALENIQQNEDRRHPPKLKNIFRDEVRDGLLYEDMNDFE